MNKKILYIDDDTNNLFSFKANFRNYFDILISESTNIEDLSKIINDNNVDIILVDQRMKLLGTDLIKELKSHHKKINCFLTSAYVSNSDINEFKKNKLIYDFFEKPWDINKIKSSIDRCVNKKKYKRIVIIDSDIFSNILNSKIINNNLKDVITYDFIDEKLSLDFLSKNHVDLILIDESIYGSLVNKIRVYHPNTPIYLLTDNFESDFYNKPNDIDNFIKKPILKSNTPLIERAILDMY